MKLRERYRRLTLWNKLSVWGAVASLVGLVATAWTLWPTDNGVVSRIDTLTGRDSFIYVVPQPHDESGNVPLGIRSVGVNPLTG